MGPNSRLWSGINVYLAGLDNPMPTDGKSDQYIQHARSLERNFDVFQKKHGDRLRNRNIRH